MGEQSLERSAIKTTAVMVVFNYAGLATSLATVPLYLEWLGAESYGLMLTALAFMGYLSFGGTGLNWGSMLLIGEAHGRNDRKQIVSIFRNSLALAAASAALALTVAAGIYGAARAGWRLPFFDANGDADLLVLLVGLQCASSMALNAALNVFVGLQEGYWKSTYGGMARLLGALAGISAAYVYRGPAAVLLAQWIASVLCGVLGATHLLRRHRWLLIKGSFISAEQISRQLRVAAKSIAVQIAETVRGTAPVMVISSFAGAAAVPLYTVPSTLLNAIFGAFLSWNISLQPAYGSAWAAGNREWVVATFQRSLRWVTLVGAVAVTGFVVSAPPAIRLWTAGNLNPGRTMCLSVAAVLVVQAISTTVQFCLIGINRHRAIAIIELLHAAIALAAIAVVVRLLGAEAVGLGAALAYATTSAWLGFRDLGRKLEDRRVVPRLNWLLGVALSATAGCLLGLGAYGWLPTSDDLIDTASGLGSALVGALATVVLLAVLRVQPLSGWTQVLRRRLPAGPP